MITIHHLLPSHPSNHPSRPVACASASTAFEVDQAPTPATPSYLLPFRVRHGFNLHKLEPRYPLIIGGINIAHDRVWVEAILGALGLLDIRQVFRDSERKQRG
ncbi:hypothetical protein DVH24_010477 [Malus domestica]|uniref:Uncharacterized protein n=1 Tax=Malus domestica TaxID=3750 RepID=A0A498JXE5_MALDO|nr:hypothetical protein DVH24_010477 [Malus domestica]